MYTDPSVANLVFVFTLNPTEVSCGGGTVRVSGAFTGPLGRTPLTGLVAIGSEWGGGLRSSGQGGDPPMRGPVFVGG